MIEASFLLSTALVSANVLTLGDSITLGCHDTSSPAAAYRFLLQDNFRAAGIEFDMVGSLSSDCGDGAVPVSGGATYDTNHEGRGHSRIGDLVPIARFAAETYDPDVVYLQVGTNHHTEVANSVIFASQFESLFDALGDTSVYVATIPKIRNERENTPWWDASFVSARNDVLFPVMNDVLKRIASERENVHIVDAFASLDPDLHILPDGFHPNLAGQALLADLFWDASKAQLIPEPSSTAYLASAFLISGVARRRRRRTA